MVVKYKLSELAKDFAVDAKEIIGVFAARGDESKKTTSTLNEDELNIVFELTNGILTQP